MSIDLYTTSDDGLHAEYRCRQEIERHFVWAVALVRDDAVWEGERGRARKVAGWHAFQIAEKRCDALGFRREHSARRIIDASKEAA